MLGTLATAPDKWFWDKIEASAWLLGKTKCKVVSPFAMSVCLSSRQCSGIRANTFSSFEGKKISWFEYIRKKIHFLQQEFKSCFQYVSKCEKRTKLVSVQFDVNFESVLAEFNVHGSVHSNNILIYIYVYIYIYIYIRIIKCILHFKNMHVEVRTLWIDIDRCSSRSELHKHSLKLRLKVF